jgi:FMN phosphatase YigB (HAD superfamily)
VNSTRIQHPKSKIQNTKVLLFDFGGTLDALGLPWRERFFRLWREEGDDVSRERFDRAFYAADDALVGAVPETLALAETVGRLARGVAKGLGSDDESLPDHVAARFCEESRKNLACSAGLLERLASRYKLAVVSNFYGNLPAVCREAGLDRFLSAAVDSTMIGCRKPDPAIFRAALEKIPAEPTESVFVGDSLERDMAGARGIGMRHVLLAGESSDGRRPCCPEDAVIRSLDELAEMFL